MTRDEFVRKIHSRIDRLNHEIDGLVARKDQIEESARADFDARLNELRLRQDSAKAQLEEMQHASESAWQDMKSGIELAWDAIAEAIDSAKSRYK